MSIRKILVGASLLWSILSVGQALSYETQPPGRWLAGDFHNHTLLTDGGHEATELFSQAFRFGLDWLANSEHGGAFGRNPKGLPWSSDTVFLGAPPAGKMWRWQSLWQYSYPLVTAARATYPDKLILQGYEWNVPTHDHASVGIIGAGEDGGRAIARHEYLFDADDSGATADSLFGLSGKGTANSHEKAVAGVQWLADKYPASSYFLINHPSRRLHYSIADLRDFNDAAPGVAFGFEGLPGHQKASVRGGYGGGPWRDGAGQDISSRARTYGGADVLLAEVGGGWDALLGEGRRFFAFANSDFHHPQADFWPGEYVKNFTYVQDTNHDGKYSSLELLDGLRSGNSFIVQGDLLNGLQFNVRSGQEGEGMGGDLAVARGDNLEITIRFRSPAVNHHGAKVMVDHIDLIVGKVHGKVGKYLGDGITSNPVYAKGMNETAKVVATFKAKDWRDDGDGWLAIVYTLRNVQGGIYCRLRGTNLGCGVAGETDAEGNPLVDDLMAPNTEAKAYADLWFYSNPIFVSAPR